MDVLAKAGYGAIERIVELDDSYQARYDEKRLRSFRCLGDAQIPAFFPCRSERGDDRAQSGTIQLTNAADVENDLLRVRLQQLIHDIAQDRRFGLAQKVSPKRDYRDITDHFINNIRHDCLKSRRTLNVKNISNWLSTSLGIS